MEVTNALEKSKKLSTTSSPFLMSSLQLLYVSQDASCRLEDGEKLCDNRQKGNVGAGCRLPPRPLCQGQ